MADTLTFRDQDGSPVQYNSGALPGTTPYWSPRVGFNWDVNGDQATQVRGGSGLFSGKPPYVWISNQIGNTGVLYGFAQTNGTTAFPFNPNPDKYKPAATGGTAASYELDVTDQGFRFPQTWRTNIGVDRKLPWGLIGTLDYIYNRDLNAPVYINANLPAPLKAPTSAWTTVRGGRRRRRARRWRRGSPSRSRRARQPARSAPASRGSTTPSAIRSPRPTSSRTRARTGRRTSRARSTKTMTHGFSFKGGFNYGVSRSLVEPSSTAGSSWGSAKSDLLRSRITRRWHTRPIRPASASSWPANYTAQYFSWGATTFSVFYDGHTNGNTSYVFSGDANGDTSQATT